MPGPWIITRPLDEALRDVGALSARGVVALALPVLERVALPWRSPRPDLVILSSASVIGAVVEAARGWDPAPAFAAMAPETAARARAAGLQVQVESSGGAVALAEAALGALERLGSPRTALYPTSRAGLSSPEQEEATRLLRARLEVWRVAVVDLVRPLDLDQRLAEAPERARWLLASPSAVHALTQAPRLPPAARVLCHGRSTLAAFAGRAPVGWPAPTLSAAATVVDSVLADEVFTSDSMETR